MHLAIGAVLLAAALRGVAQAKGANTLVGGVYLASNLSGENPPFAVPGSTPLAPGFAWRRSA